MHSTARGSLPNSFIAASSSGATVTEPLPPTRSVSSSPGTNKTSCKRPVPSTMFLKLSIRLLPGRSGISSRFGPQRRIKPGWPPPGDHAGGRLGVDRLEVVGAELAHHRSPKSRGYAEIITAAKSKATPNPAATTPARASQTASAGAKIIFGGMAIGNVATGDAVRRHHALEPGADIGRDIFILAVVEGERGAGTRATGGEQGDWREPSHSILHPALGNQT